MVVVYNQLNSNIHTKQALYGGRNHGMQASVETELKTFDSANAQVNTHPLQCVVEIEASREPITATLIQHRKSPKKVDEQPKLVRETK